MYVRTTTSARESGRHVELFCRPAETDRGKRNRPDRPADAGFRDLEAGPSFFQGRPADLTRALRSHTHTHTHTHTHRIAAAAAAKNSFQNEADAPFQNLPSAASDHTVSPWA
jgi:hypothetical protein